MTIFPAEFARHSLEAMEASEGRRKRRKRDTTPDKIGLGLKRELLEGIVADAPAPEDLEAWLFERTLRPPASGAVRAMCADIMDEYRIALVAPSFRAWLESGAPSDDRDGAPATACDAAGVCEHPDHRRMQAALDGI